ncbi:D-alanyl-D-alanine carboxypeptidase family protein [Nitratireductor luteus]|uniref:D-alanyl-D-alanine carboxypeptidase family protein n=1 Tax=Nitratireductor luteus TaxID=2976980 RepID=UPI00223EE0DC|nr:D-alanyl-D-alanine carboxypeptidase family protein [Nitratireductor luteus]
MRIWLSCKTLTAILALALTVAALPAFAGPHILFDVKSGKVLSEEDAFRRWYPASITKLMTAYVAFRAVQAGEMQLDSPVRVSKNASQEPPSKMGYPPGSVLTLDNAIKILMVKSANDIATAVAESVGGSENAFVGRMNAEARRLGMTDTRFVNAHGLHSPQQYSTARDLALLVRALRTEFAAYAGYYSIEALSAGDKTLPNYNMLVGRFPGADGMKTGYICASGFNLVATATRNGRTLAAIVLGAFSQVERAEIAASLLDKGFRQSGPAAPTLASLRPTNPQRNSPTDLRPQVCSPEAVAKRNEQRDDEGRLVMTSDLIKPMEREPHAVAVGLGGATGPESTAPRYANVPIPTPRPDYPPRHQAISAGDG